MPRIFKKTCENCNEYYEGYGARFCSMKCHDRKRQKHSKATKEKISIAHIGMKKPWAGKYKRTEATKEKISKAYTGKPRLDLRGEKHGRWKGGVSSIHCRIRQSTEYKEWRRKVFERDNYICRNCKSESTRRSPLNAHHIKPFAYYPKLRFEISNGMTLCKDCHKKIPIYKNKEQICLV